jgi:nicotinic acid mononucleotide adenylyltransferase
MDIPWQMSEERWDGRFARAADLLNDASWLLRLDERLRAAQERGAPVTTLEPVAPTTTLERVGVFTGSFNPLTWAHVAVADTARAALRLDALLWACSRVTVDKEAVERATLLDRIAQVSVLVEAEGADARGDSAAVVDAGLYVQQARALRAVIGPKPKLLLIVGYDKIVQILDPRYYDDRDASLAELFALAELSVAPRAEADERALAELLSLPANRPYAAAIHYLPVAPQVARLSSTMARARARTCDDRRARALAEIVPPEGAALACTTGAYANGQADAYAWRQRWLEALRQGGWAGAERLDLRVLVARTMEQTELGEVTRRWLWGERWPGGPASVEELVRALRA